MKTWVKFCGLTDPAHVALVPDGGAAGFVVGVPASPRNLSIDAARRLSEPLSSEVEIWAVTADPPAELIRSLFDDFGVDRIQVHGRVPDGLEFLEAHHVVPSLVIPPAGSGQPDPRVPLAEEYPIVHFDAPGDPLPKGSPDRVDWETCRRLVDANPGRKLVLAGGLDSGCVAEAMGAVRPWGVDVSAGVESAPGRKDPEKMRAFLTAVESAESTL